MYSDGSTAQNIMPAAKIENTPPLPSQRENNPVILVITYDTQLEVMSKAGPPVEVRVASGGAADKNLIKIIEIEEDE